MNQMNGNISRQLVDPDNGAAGTKTLAAGTSDKKSAWVSNVGFSAICFNVLLGAITATGTIALTVEHSDDQATVVVETGISAAVTDADGSKVVSLEVVRPQYKYSRVSIDRATANSVINGILWEGLNPADAPVADHATVLASPTCQSIAN